MVRTTPFRQKESGWMVYPGYGWRKILFKAPLFFWRLGLARLSYPPFLLLTTVGRKSGAPRRTMLEYAYINGHIYISSGWGERAQWYKNVLANPFVTVQTVREGTISGKAVLVADDEEISMLYQYMRGKSPIWTPYLDSWGIKDSLEDFLAKKDRLYILRVEAIQVETPPPLKTDLVWVWPLIAGIVLILILLLSKP